MVGQTNKMDGIEKWLIYDIYEGVLGNKDAFFCIDEIDNPDGYIFRVGSIIFLNIIFSLNVDAMTKLINTFAS